MCECLSDSEDERDPERAERLCQEKCLITSGSQLTVV